MNNFIATYIKNKFGITELLSGRSYTQLLKKRVRTSKNCGPEAWIQIENWFDYSDGLHDTPITEDLFNGDNPLFEGFEKKNNDDRLVASAYYTPRFCIFFYKPYEFEGETTIKVQAYTIKENGWQVDKEEFIKSLYDLAELTKSNPLKLK